MPNKRVLIGMSGGVDSSVSALLLKQQGYEVIGITMKLFDNEKNEIDNDTEIKSDAKKICDILGIEYHVFDYKAEFRKCVVDNFVCEYKNCRTPNPCVECNKHLKFGAMYKKALELDCEYISTGHYAKIEYSDKYGQYVMKKSEADKKDQTYFLYGINKEILPKLIFPLENFKEKAEIRKIAAEYNLPVAEKKDSEEICFIPDNNYINFLNENILFKEIAKGKIKLQDGTILGEHNGLINYTVGQRKGLGIAYKEPLYVLKLEKETNSVIVGKEKELYSNVLNAKDLNFLIDIDLNKKIEVKAKIRYRAQESDAVLEVLENGIAKVEFKEPQRAITPGQSVVFYIEDDILLGGGKII